jgi:hypothetical protein
MTFNEHPDTMSFWRHAWLYWLAWFRLSPYAVCAMSQGRGMADDFHDYPDTQSKEPFHMSTDYCVRCGKEFIN